MPGWIWAIIAIVIVVACVILITRMLAQNKTQHLQQRFGPEYDRTARAAESKKAAETELEQREERRETLAIRPLPADSRRRYAAKWQDVQTDFVDSPADAVAEADVLVHRVMSDRGYPMDDFEQRAADISVDHPMVVENYRRAHRVFEAIAGDDVTTEQERQAMQHYRVLFDELLEGSETEPNGEIFESNSTNERTATHG